MVTTRRRPYRLVLVKAGIGFCPRREYPGTGPAIADGQHFVRCGWDRAWVRTEAGVDLYRIEIPRRAAR